MATTAIRGWPLSLGGQRAGLQNAPGIASRIHNHGKSVGFLTSQLPVSCKCLYLVLALPVLKPLLGWPCKRREREVHELNKLFSWANSSRPSPKFSKAHFWGLSNMWICIYIYVYTHMYLSLSIYMQYACTYIHMNLYIHTHVYIHIHMYVNTYIHISVRVHICTDRQHHRS